ncbi:MAG TPA: TetR/AcrR family transcriptional regulator [Pseudonocardiaceae bacterium]|nr:TetR/AcrR family transcriptional regulator [Pseudonocardiaceae bacterium]
MPRQKEFDVDAVCERALNLFWRRGYAATSVNDLVGELGIGKASLYAAFGPKHQLYLTALRRYVERSAARIVVELGSDGSPAAAVRNLVDRYVDQALDQGELGCLVVNAAIELMPADPEVGRLVGRSWDTIEVALTVTLTRAVAGGELPEHSDPAALAAFLLTFLQGVRVLGKRPDTAQRLRAAAATALRVLGTN